MPGNLTTVHTGSPDPAGIKKFIRSYANCPRGRPFC